MLIDELMRKKGMTKYRLSKESGVPYATIEDLCDGRKNIDECPAKDAYAIAEALGIPIETLLETRPERRIDFEAFKSGACHRLKWLGDIDFMIALLEENDIRRYYDMGWYPEALYLLAMLDYLSRINDIPLCLDYEDIRHTKLKELLYPPDVLLIAHVFKSDEPKKRAVEGAIPEFLRFNIVEGDVRDVA